MSDRFYLRTASAIGALWYVDGAGSPSWTMERPAAYPFPSALAARLWRKGLGLTPATCRIVRIVRVGPPRRKAPPASRSALREVLAEILAGEDGSAAPFRHDGNAPGHAHTVPGRWDRDGSPCAWCATWARAEALVGTLAEMAPPAAPVAPGRVDGTPDGCQTVQSPAARPEGSQAPDPGGWRMGDVWMSPTGHEHEGVDVGASWATLRIPEHARESSACFGSPAANGWRLVSRAGKPWPPEAP